MGVGGGWGLKLIRQDVTQLGVRAYTGMDIGMRLAPTPMYVCT